MQCIIVIFHFSNFTDLIEEKKKKQRKRFEEYSKVLKVTGLDLGRKKWSESG